MTEPTNRGHVRKSLIYAAVAAAAATSLLIAYLLGAFEERGTVRSDDICRNVPDRQETAKVFNSVLPRSSEYHFDETWRPDADWGFKSGCGVDGENDGRLFYLEAHAVSTVSSTRWADHEIPSTAKGKLTDFNAGIKGVSTADVAAIYVPCYSRERESNEPYSLTVLAHALEPLEVSAGEERQTLVKLATDFARQAHKDAKCDLPSKLPE